MRKTTYIWCAVVLSLFVGSFAVTSLAGNDEQANVKEKAADDQEKATDQNMAYLRVSGELAQLAQDSKDAILMLAAARLEAMAATEEVSRDKTSTGDTAKADVESKPEKEDFYALAEQYAGTNEALQTLIEDSKASGATRGAWPRPKSGTTSVLAGDTDVFRITFRGGEWAEVTVVGDGDTDLDLYVYDANGNLIDIDTDPTDVAYCSWIPRWTATFRVEVKNWGRVYNRYRITTN